jgi:hypothetical protein
MKQAASKTVFSSETSDDIHWNTGHYVPEGRTLQHFNSSISYQNYSAL